MNEDYSYTIDLSIEASRDAVFAGLNKPVVVSTSLTPLDIEEVVSITNIIHYNIGNIVDGFCSNEYDFKYGDGEGTTDEQ